MVLADAVGSIVAAVRALSSASFGIFTVFLSTLQNDATRTFTTVTFVISLSGGLRGQVETPGGLRVAPRFAFEGGHAQPGGRVEVGERVTWVSYPTEPPTGQGSRPQSGVGRRATGQGGSAAVLILPRRVRGSLSAGAVTPGGLGSRPMTRRRCDE